MSTPLSPWFDIDARTLRLSASSLSTWLECGLKFQNSRVHGREPVRSPVAQQAGKAVHQALRPWESGGSPAHDQGSALWAQMLELVAAELPLPPAGLEADDPDSIPGKPEWRTRERIADLLAAYCEHYAGQDFTVLSSEHSWECDLGTLANGWLVRWSGIFDARIKWRGMPLVLERKTSSRGGSNVMAGFRLSTQNKGYAWADAELRGVPQAGVLLDLLIWRPPTERPSKTPRNEFVRELFTYSSHQLAQWRADTLWHAERIIALMLERGGRDPWPSSETACVGKYGRCPYYSVCDLPTLEQQRMMLATDYFTDRAAPVRSAVAALNTAAVTTP